MNYGYSDACQNVMLEPKDESDRYSIQLYHHLANAVDLNNREILEIGCGRGGGLAYITRQFSPDLARGIDLNKQAIKFCNGHYTESELSFLQADAQNLPLDNNTYDVVLNVESSHRYPDMSAFLGEVFRILRPDGYFLFTDFRYDNEIPDLKKYLLSSGLTLVKEENITQQVVAALDLDDARKRQLVEKLVPGILHKTALNFAGAIGSKTYNKFVSRKFVYYSYIFQKNNHHTLRDS